MELHGTTSHASSAPHGASRICSPTHPARLVATPGGSKITGNGHIE